MKIWKKNLVAAAVLVTVCTGIYMNWLYTDQQTAADLIDTLDAEKVMSDELLDLEDVQEYLNAYDCTVTVVEQPHAYFPIGEIISTYPEAGQPTVHDITLYVSAGWTE